MSEEKAKRLFSKRYIAHIKRAWELNYDKSISGDIYFHPTENKIMKKSIDLGKRQPLCDVNSTPGKTTKRNWEERWIEAYLINQAKKNNWRLPLAGKNYRFLASQLKFRKDDSKKERQGKILDLLLYDEKQNRLVVLELKKEADKEILNTAKAELDNYIAKLKDIVRTEMDALKEAFFDSDKRNLVIKDDVLGYVVWPESEVKFKQSQDIDKQLDKYGLIEYEYKYKKIQKPWEAFTEYGYLEINFACCKNAEPVL